MSSLDEFLKNAGTRPSTRCSICKNAELAAEVVRYLDGHDSGEIPYTLNYMWANFFGPEYGVRSLNTLRNHIRIHLGREYTS